MKCIIPGANVKVFGKAIHCLSKIGEELYFEPLLQGLALRTVNSSRSAYGCFVFAPSFFQHYNDGSSTTPQDGDTEPIKCKIGVKSCLSVFKSLSTLEKTVDRCKITMNLEDARLVFLMYCRHGIVKTYNLAFIECETLQAVFSKVCPNVIRTQSRLLSETVLNFQMTQEEISLIVNPEKVTFKNYVDDQPDPAKVIHTEMAMDPDEFENYQVGVDTVVTFCLKELRAILGFTEAANLPVAIHFESAGKPIIFSIDTDPSFEANFVLATLAPPGDSQQSCSQVPKQRKTQQNTSRISSQSVRGRSNAAHAARTTENRTVQPVKLHQNRINENRSVSRDPGINHNTHTNRSMASGDGPEANRPVGMETSPTSNGTHRSDEQRLEQPFDSGKNDTTFTSPVFGGLAQIDDEESSPSIPLQHTLQTHNRPIDLSVLEDLEEAEDDLVPGTPPNKKFKSMFFGMSQSTTAGTQNPVLAEDTDEDD